MLRQENPIAAQLAPSHAHLRIFLGDAPVDVPSALAERCNALKGEVVVEHGPYGPALKIEASHADIDAFGMAYLACNSGLERLPAVPLTSVTRRDGMIAEYTYRQIAMAVPVSSSAQTITQRVLARVLPKIDAPMRDHLAIAVACDDCQALSWSTFLGNSCVFVELDRKRQDELLAATKQAWRAKLAESARRIVAIARRRPGRLRSAAPFRVSSVGDLGQHGWIRPWFTPATCDLVSTPGRHDAVNLVLWGAGPWQSLALSGMADHPVMGQFDQIVDAWRVAIKA